MDLNDVSERNTPVPPTFNYKGGWLYVEVKKLILDRGSKKKEIVEAK